jgi:hypothetical protein
MQQFLKPATGAAGAGIVAAELFAQFLVAVDDAPAVFDLGFRREASSAFAARFVESTLRRVVVSWPSNTSVVCVCV